MWARGERVLLVIATILAIIAVGSIALNTTGAVVYSRGAAGSTTFLDSGSIADYYYQYSEIFDFFLFLLLFLGLSQMILSKHFEQVNKSVYVAVGIFLALALVLWENRAGTTLIELSGPIPIAILLIGLVL